MNQPAHPRLSANRTSKRNTNPGRKNSNKFLISSIAKKCFKASITQFPTAACPKTTRKWIWNHQAYDSRAILSTQSLRLTKHWNLRTKNDTPKLGNTTSEALALLQQIKAWEFLTMIITILTWYKISTPANVIDGLFSLLTTDQCNGRSVFFFYSPSTLIHVY